MQCLCDKDSEAMGPQTRLIGNQALSILRRTLLKFFIPFACYPMLSSASFRPSMLNYTRKKSVQWYTDISREMLLGNWGDKPPSLCGTVLMVWTLTTSFQAKKICCAYENERHPRPSHYSFFFYYLMSLGSGFTKRYTKLFLWGYLHACWNATESIGGSDPFGLFSTVTTWLDVRECKCKQTNKTKNNQKGSANCSVLGMLLILSHLFICLKYCALKCRKQTQLL